MAGLTEQEFAIVKDAAKKAPKPRKAKKYPLEESYEKVKDQWHGKEDLSGHRALIEGKALEADILNAAGGNRKLAQKYNEAIQVHIDAKRAPDGS